MGHGMQWGMGLQHSTTVMSDVMMPSYIHIYFDKTMKVTGTLKVVLATMKLINLNLNKQHTQTKKDPTVDF